VNIRPNQLLILDTNILVHWVRQDRTGQHLQQHYHLDLRLERPLFSTITEGEIRGLVKCWNWGASKLDKLEEILNELVRLEAGLPEVVAAYADLYVEDQRQGHNTKQNDLWIAASAVAADAVLLTCDQDFDWMSPGLVQVEHILDVV
jgi:predicted nucleic acid-binding protein